MASLKVLLICICLAVLSVKAQEGSVEGNLDVIGYVWADSFSDGTTYITGGDITAESMTLTGSLTAGDATLMTLTSTGARFADLYTMELYSRTINTDELRVSGDANFEGNLDVEGHLYAGDAMLGETRTELLTVEGETNIEGILFGQSNVQVTADLNVGGNGRLTGDVLANMSMSVAGMLSAANTWSGAVTVSDFTQTGELNVRNMATLNDLEADAMNISGSLHVEQDLMAENLMIMGNLTSEGALFRMNAEVGANVTVGGYFWAEDAMFSESYMARSQWIGGSLTVGEMVSVGMETYVGENLYGMSNISATGMVTGMWGMFEELMVDTATIESLTSEFIMTEEFNAQRGVVEESFVVTGMTTVDSLDVLGFSSFKSVHSKSVMTDDLEAGVVTTGELSVMDMATLTFVEVSSHLVVGDAAPNENWSANIEDSYIDHLTAIELMAEWAWITQLDGDYLRADSIYGMTANISDFNSEMAEIQMSWIDVATITNLTAMWANFTHLDAMNVWAENITGENAYLMDLWTQSIWASNITTENAMVNMTTAMNTETPMLHAMDGDVHWLWSTDATVDTLWAMNATTTLLTSETATIEHLWGETLTYPTGTIASLYSDVHMSSEVTASSSVTTENLWAERGNLTNFETTSLMVTETAWFGNLTSTHNLTVEEFSVLDGGFIAGDVVVSGLTVASDTVFTFVSVSNSAFLTDLMVKQMTSTETLNATSASLGQFWTESLTAQNAYLESTLDIASNFLINGSLLVNGTAESEVGSFSSVGAATTTSTDLEAELVRAATGVIARLTTTDLEVSREAILGRALVVEDMGGPATDEKIFWSNNRLNALTASRAGVEFDIRATNVLHTGDASIDSLVFTTAESGSEAALLITGDGALDFLGGELNFDGLAGGEGIVFENEQNVAWVASSASPSANLSPGGTSVYYDYDDLIDRDMESPGAFYDPTRFMEPANTAGDDLLTLTSGHYRISGGVYFEVVGGASANSVVRASAGVEAFPGMNSTMAPSEWSTYCWASFSAVTGSQWGGSCFFENILVVPAGEMMTLRTRATWVSTSATLANTLAVGDRSTLMVEELFERTSESL